MNTLECFLGVRVFLPPVILPHIVFGRLVPLPCLPSPPPYGWSTGFIAVPLTLGRMPSHLERPAFPRTIVLCSMFETVPMEAYASPDTNRVSEDGITTCT